MRMRNKLQKLKKPLKKLLVRTQSSRFYGGMGRIVRKELQVLEVSRADWEVVHAILNPGAADPLLPQGEKCTTYIAKRKGRVIGYVQLVHAEKGSGLPPGLWLFSLWVRVWYRRMGVGELLSLRVAQAARERGAVELYLMLFEDNLPAVRLYQKLGFKPRVFPELEDRLDTAEQSCGRKQVVMAVSVQDVIDPDSP
jgi:ribosomal protein S18 acetylase RimI-like enzyme